MAVAKGIWLLACCSLILGVGGCPKGCKCLRIVGIVGCRGVLDPTELMETATYVRVLNIEGTNAINPSVLRRLIAAAPLLHRVRMDPWMGRCPRLRVTVVCFERTTTRPTTTRVKC